MDCDMRSTVDMAAKVGSRVTLNKIGCAARDGVIVHVVNAMKDDNSVYVRFDGIESNIPCHPHDLIYHPHN